LCPVRGAGNPTRQTSRVTLISARAVAAELASEHPPTLLDVRWSLGSGAEHAQYLRAHIPGAAFIDLDAELAAPPGAGGRHPLPDAEGFAAAMRAAGVRNDGTVVVYDASSAMAAARAWWLLRYFGHGHVAVLDGGFDTWTQAGLPLQTGAPRIAAGDFVARAGAMPVLDAAAAAGLAKRGRLLDARAPERFRGEREPVDPVAGHIPGALNRPSTRNLDPSGRFLDPSALRGAFAGLGLTPDEPVGAYCGSGVTAAHEVLALELAGYPAALYPGSWSEWITDPGRPVATGS
jgi:thiosulfate/3-mercaptopyruvate sulfurtransferase